MTRASRQCVERIGEGASARDCLSDDPRCDPMTPEAGLGISRLERVRDPTRGADVARVPSRLAREQAVPSERSHVLVPSQRADEPSGVTSRRSGVSGVPCGIDPLEPSVLGGMLRSFPAGGRRRELAQRHGAWSVWSRRDELHAKRFVLPVGQRHDAVFDGAALEVPVRVLDDYVCVREASREADDHASVLDTQRSPARGRDDRRDRVISRLAAYERAIHACA